MKINTRISNLIYLFSTLGVTMKPTTVLSLPLEVLLRFVAVLLILLNTPPHGNAVLASWHCGLHA
jgi:hypothetical protein